MKKVLRILSAIAGTILVLYHAALLILQHLNGIQVSSPLAAESDFAVIGGADGPTVIFVTGSASPYPLVIGIALLAVAAVLLHKRRP